MSRSITSVAANTRRGRPFLRREWTFDENLCFGQTDERFVGGLRGDAVTLGDCLGVDDGVKRQIVENLRGDGSTDPWLMTFSWVMPWASNQVKHETHRGR